MNAARPNHTLFVGDLSKFCGEGELASLFSVHGQLLDVKVKRNLATGKTLSYGFVTFAHEFQAQDALNHLDGAMVSGRKLRYSLLLQFYRHVYF